LVVLCDLIDMARVGAVDLLWGDAKVGGVASGARPAWFVWDTVHESLPSGWWLWSAQVACLLLLAVGLWARPAAACFALLSAQAAWMLPAGDRGIDVLIRNAAWLLAMGRCDAVWSVSARWRTGSFRGDGGTIPAWPRQLLWLQLLAVYFLAGIQKFGASWTPVGDFLALWYILQDWSITRGPPTWIRTAPGVLMTQVATALTVLWEWTAPALLLAAAARRRGGWLGAVVARFRPDDVWVGFGVAFHLGIAATLDLGIFPWATLALYPAFARVPLRTEPDEAPAVASVP
jgi:hypothetical protein